MARILITVRTTPGNIPTFDVRELETRLAAAARRWEDDLKQALIESAGEARGNDYFRRFPHPRDPSNHLDGLWQYLYPSRPTT